MRGFPVTAVHACVCRDGEQAGGVAFQSQLCMHVCAVMGINVHRNDACSIWGRSSDHGEPVHAQL